MSDIIKTEAVVLSKLNYGDTSSIVTLYTCLLYTSDAADERSSVDLGGRRIIKKKKKVDIIDQRRSRQKKRNRDNIETNK